MSIYKEGPTFRGLPQVINEQILLRDNLRQVSTLQRALQLTGAVARVLLNPLPDGRVPVGTGFLVDRDLFLTNNHVFPTKEAASTASIQFNYQRDLANNLLPIDEYRCDPNTYFFTDKNLDFTLVKLQNNPGARWGFIGLPNESAIEVGEDVFIIQHPGGKEKMVGLSENTVSAIVGDKIQYMTDTEGGSSGSPVFNDRWELVALHHAAISDGSGKVLNEGISIGSIKKKLLVH